MSYSNPKVIHGNSFSQKVVFKIRCQKLEMAELCQNFVKNDEIKNHVHEKMYYYQKCS
jgi:hypothetical protein